MIDISVIILNYNTFDLTCACIRSIYKYTEGVTFEIVVVDNGSSECSPNLFAELFPDVILIASSVNLGFAKGNNLGIKHATGKTVLLLNSDTEVLNNALFLAYQRLMLDEAVGALTGRIITPFSEVQHVSGSSKKSDTRFALDKVITQNKFKVISIIRSSRYARVYFLVKALQYTTSGYTHGKRLAKLYIKTALIDAAHRKAEKANPL